MYRHLEVLRGDGIERLILNRPDVRNAFNEEMIAELTTWAAAVAAAPDVRVVIIQGAGKSFSAGADITWMAKTVRYAREENLRDAHDASRMFAAINSLPIPVIGRIHGAALGGGAGLAAVCDLVVTTPDTVFGFTEVKLGIVPAVISPFVIDKIGRSAARELFLSGARFSAARAREIGLVHYVVADGELDEAIARVATEFMSAGREAIAAAKALVAAVPHLSPAAAADLTAATIAERRVSPEGQEGLQAFLEKRKPRWSVT